MDLKTYISSERGNATKLAEAIDVSMSYLSQMINGTSPISPRRAVQIEEATQGAVTRKDLRADWSLLWPELREPA